MRYKLLIFLFLFPLLSMGEEIKPFTTDGCSSFPDGNMKQQSLWVNCCIRHDLAYWKGGTLEDKQQADKALESCVTKVGEPKIAAIMLAGVKVGGSAFLPTSYRWGYGWSYPRAYKPLSVEEKMEAKKKLDMFKLMINNLTHELN